jgi:hypothetical protein
MGQEAIKQSVNKSNDIDVSDLGRPDSLKYNILTLVINEEYDRAIRTLKEFIESDSEYPNFRVRIERYAMHSIDLIYAIRTKRNFPGLSALTRTKQQELKDKFLEHFNELRFMLRKIEDRIEDLRLKDVRSTGMVVKSFWFSLVVVFISGLFLELIRGLGYTLEIVFNAYVEKAFNLIFDKFM